MLLFFSLVLQTRPTKLRHKRKPQKRGRRKVSQTRYQTRRYLERSKTRQSKATLEMALHTCRIGKNMGLLFETVQRRASSNPFERSTT